MFEQIKGFGSYGFPESHAASFACIVYASCWLKCHEPAAFACALLNAQPMGFYAPRQIVQDAQRHRVAVRAGRRAPQRLGLHAGSRPGLRAVDSRRAPPRPAPGARLSRGRRAAADGRARQRAFADVADLCARAGLDARHRELLAEAGALRGLAGHRHRAHWAIAGVEAQLPLFGHASPDEEAIALPPPSQAEDTLADYARTGLSLGPHPLRPDPRRLRAARCLDSRTLHEPPHASRVRAAGLVTQRQRPQTASGVTFITLEDEYGPINVVVWRQVAERQWRVFLESRLLGVDGRWEQVDGVSHLIAARLTDLSELLGPLDSRSRDFH